MNGVYLKAFIDLGSDVVTLKESSAIKLKLNYNKITQLLKGFGKVITYTLGTAFIQVVLDGIEFDVEALIVGDDTQNEPIMIGRSILDRNGIVVVKGYKSLNVFKVPNGLIHISNTDTNKLVVSVSNDDAINNKCDIDSTELNVTTLPNEKNDSSYCPNSNLNPVSNILLHENSCHYSNNENDINKIFLTDLKDNLNIYSEEKYCEIEFDHKLSKDYFQSSDIVNIYQTARVINENNICLEKSEDRVVCNEESLSVNKIMFSSFESDLINESINNNIENIGKDQVRNLIAEFRDCFAFKTSELGKTNKAEIKINLTNEDPVFYHPYRLSATQRANVRAQINELLELNIISTSNSDFASPIVIVKKKNGEERICVDYRRLNAKTIKDRFPMPNIEENLQRLAGNRFFTVLDLASGYYQIPVCETSRKYTSFVTPDGQFEFNRMPFGLSNAPAVFQRLMNRFSQELNNVITPYLDDIILPSRTIEEGIALLRKVLLKLREYGLTLKLSKCKFLCEKVDYLGHEISFAGIQPGVGKILCVEKFPTPTNVHEVRQFIGLCSYFRKFVEKFAIIAEPLTRLTRKNENFSWADEQKSAFESLKQKLCSRDVLVLYDFSKEHEIHTDACMKGLAGVLLQKDENGRMNPVCYFSRQTSASEKKFHSYELEALAVVESLEKFRIYVLGKEFCVVTDCSALQTASTKRDMSSRIARWWLKLLEFNFKIQHRHGKIMTHIDALSRNPVEVSREIEPASIDIFRIEIDVDSDWMNLLQDNDPEINDLKKKINLNPTKHKEFLIENNRLYRIVKEYKLFVVPKGVRGRIVYNCHDAVGHFGLDKTILIIQRSFWWPRMRQFVKKYLNSCFQCLYHRENREANKITLHPIEKVPVPCHTWHVDHLGPFTKSSNKNLYILVIVDAFTKYVNLKATRDTSSRFVVSMIKNISEHFGLPKRIISDRGSAFTSKSFRTFCEENDIAHVLNATATPRGNGQVERYNRTILHSLKTLCDNDPSKWENHLRTIQCTLNSTPHAITKKSPNELLFGFEVRPLNADKLTLKVYDEQIDNKNYDPMQTIEIRQDASSKIQANQAKQKEMFAQKFRSPSTYKVGDMVVVFREPPATGESRKLTRKFRGPYKVTDVLFGDRYRVEESDTCDGRRRFRGVVPADHMRLVVPPTDEDIDCSSSDEDDS